MINEIKKDLREKMNMYTKDRDNIKISEKGNNFWWWLNGNAMAYKTALGIVEYYEEMCDNCKSIHLEYINEKKRLCENIKIMHYDDTEFTEGYYQACKNILNKINEINKMEEEQE